MARPPPGRRLKYSGFQPRSSPTSRSSVTASVTSAGGHTSDRCDGPPAAGARTGRAEAGARGGAGRTAGTGGTDRSERPACGFRGGGATRYSPSSSTLGQVQNRLRSPQALSMRATEGQNLPSFTHGAGKAPVSREYGRSQLAAVTACAV